jgi:hypothetical protein
LRDSSTAHAAANCARTCAHWPGLWLKQGTPALAAMLRQCSPCIPGTGHGEAVSPRPLLHYFA